MKQSKFLAFPWLFIPFAVYNVVAFLEGSAALKSVAFSLTLLSGAVFEASTGDLILLLSVLLLLIEAGKVSAGYRISILDLTIAFALLLLCISEFLVRREAGTATFLLLTGMTFTQAVLRLISIIGFGRKPVKGKA